MSQELLIPSDEAVNFIRTQVSRGIPPAIIEAIASHIDRAREAAARVVEEGSVVRDMKGSVIAHPAIRIEADAIKAYTDLILKVRNY